jgi:hypothetical protein
MSYTGILLLVILGVLALYYTLGKARPHNSGKQLPYVPSTPITW